MARSTHESREHMMPVDLLRSAPRPVGLTPAGVTAVLFAAALLAGAVGAAAALYAVVRRDAERTRLFLTEGRTATATVTRVREGRGKRAQLTVHYRYVAAGHEHAGTAKLRRRDPLTAGVRNSESISVRYLPSAPEQSWPAGHEPRGLPFWVPAAVAIALAAGSVPIAIVLRRQRHLLENGRAALARVTGTKKVQHSHTGDWRIDYEWTLLSGARARGRYDTTKRPPDAGSALPILYDPDQPRHSVRYPLRLVRLKEL
jgi:hypothetical protein